MLFFFNWKMAVASPLGASSRFYHPWKLCKPAQSLRKKGNGCQTYLRRRHPGMPGNTAPDRINNYEDKYLVSLKEKFANAEKTDYFTELGASAFVSSAQMFLKLGIATTALIGGKLLIQGQIHI